MMPGYPSALDVSECLIKDVTVMIWLKQGIIFPQQMNNYAHSVVNALVTGMD